MGSGDGDCLGSGTGEGDSLGVGDCLGSGAGEGDSAGDGEGEGDSPGDGDAFGSGAGEGDSPGVGDGDSSGDGDGMGLCPGFGSPPAPSLLKFPLASAVGTASAPGDPLFVGPQPAHATNAKSESEYLRPVLMFLTLTSLYVLTRTSVSVSGAIFFWLDPEVQHESRIDRKNNARAGCLENTKQLTKQRGHFVAVN